MAGKNSDRSLVRFRLALVGEESGLLGEIEAELQAKGCQVERALNLEDALLLVKGFRPHLMVVALNEENTDKDLEILNAEEFVAGIPKVLTTGPGILVDSDRLGERCELIEEPGSAKEVLDRIFARLELISLQERLDSYEERLHTLAEILGFLGAARTVESILLTLAHRVAHVSGADRCTLMVPHHDGSDLYWLTSNDDSEVHVVEASPVTFPELAVMDEEATEVDVPDARANSRFKDAAARLEAEGTNSLALFPVDVPAGRTGVMALSFGTREPRLSENDRMICRMIKDAAALAIGCRGTIRPTSGISGEAISLPFSTESRLKDLERFEAYFENAAEAMLILDESGHVLSLNKEGEKVLGRSRSELLGESFPNLFHETSKPLAEDMVVGFRQGEFPRFLDMYIDRDGDMRCLSVSSGSLHEAHGRAVISLRDVTDLRETEDELRRTKEFLENLIDGSIQGIVAWDVFGDVLLFNKGAERITGRSADDIVGTATVRDLFPEGVTDELLDQLKSDKYGGTGRLENVRKDLLGRDGQRIPVSLTASVVYEDGEEAATVAIFSDLRERLAMEKKLSQAREKLVQSEKQAMLAELAGTTAHELNQPLTSVMGYAELLLRKIPEDNPNRHTVEVIFKEAERMAQIVKKIGKITKYRTTTYVGSTKIVDLDKSTEDSE